MFVGFKCYVIFYVCWKLRLTTEAWWVGSERPLGNWKEPDNEVRGMELWDIWKLGHPMSGQMCSLQPCNCFGYIFFTILIKKTSPVGNIYAFQLDTLFIYQQRFYLSYLSIWSINKMYKTHIIVKKSFIIDEIVILLIFRVTSLAQNENFIKNG